MHLFPKALLDFSVVFSSGRGMKFYNNILISNNAKRNLALYLLFKTTFHP